MGNWVVQVALKHEVQEIRRVRGEMESLADTVAAHLARYHMVTLCDNHNTGAAGAARWPGG